MPGGVKVGFNVVLLFLVFSLFHAVSSFMQEVVKTQQQPRSRCLQRLSKKIDKCHVTKLNQVLIPKSKILTP